MITSCSTKWLCRAFFKPNPFFEGFGVVSNFSQYRQGLLGFDGMQSTVALLINLEGGQCDHHSFHIAGEKTEAHKEKSGFPKVTLNW